MNWIKKESEDKLWLFIATNNIAFIEIVTVCQKRGGTNV